jgi:uncharacterized protein YyaL (SSP411 family)
MPNEWLPSYPYPTGAEKPALPEESKCGWVLASVTPPSSVQIAGDPATAAEWQRELERTLRPAVRVFNVAGAALPAALVKGPLPQSGAVGWVCQGTHCLPPVEARTEVERLLSG